LLIARLMRAALLVLLLSSCAFAPGMYMDDGDFKTQDVNKDDFREGVSIQTINGALVVQHLQARQQQKFVLPAVLKEDVRAYRYKIAPQDALDITVWDHPELTNPGGSLQSSRGRLVYDNGTIFYPYAGTVHVAGKTMDEVRALLTKKLSATIEKPQVGVQVASFRGRSVYITGQVQKAGAVLLTDHPLTVMDALSQAGGVLPTADLQHAILTREGKTYALDLVSLYERGMSEVNVLLHDGDALNIPDNRLNKVFVLGQVAQPASLFLQNGQLSLAEAISDANGFGAKANPGQVYVIRGQRSGKPVSIHDRFDQAAKMEIYHLDASSPEALLLADQFPLQARDIVYVSPTQLSRFSSVFIDLQRVVNTTAQTLILKKAAGL